MKILIMLKLVSNLKGGMKKKIFEYLDILQFILPNLRIGCFTSLSHVINMPHTIVYILYILLDGIL